MSGAMREGEKAAEGACYVAHVNEWPPEPMPSIGEKQLKTIVNAGGRWTSRGSTDTAQWS